MYSTRTCVHARIPNGHPREEKRASSDKCRRTSRRAKRAARAAARQSARREDAARQSARRGRPTAARAALTSALARKSARKYVSVSVSVSVSVPWNLSLTWHRRKTAQLSLLYQAADSVASGTVNSQRRRPWPLTSEPQNYSRVNAFMPTLLDDVHTTCIRACVPYGNRTRRTHWRHLQILHAHGRADLCTVWTAI